MLRLPPRKQRHASNKHSFGEKNRSLLRKKLFPHVRINCVCSFTMFFVVCIYLFARRNYKPPKDITAIMGTRLDNQKQLRKRNDIQNSKLAGNLLNETGNSLEVRSDHNKANTYTENSIIHENVLPVEHVGRDCAGPVRAPLTSFEITLYGHKVTYFAPSNELGMSVFQHETLQHYDYKILKTAVFLSTLSKKETTPTVVDIGSGVGVFSLYAEFLGADTFALSTQYELCRLHYVASHTKHRLNLYNVEGRGNEDLWGQIYEKFNSVIASGLFGRAVGIMRINIPGLGLKFVDSLNRAIQENTIDNILLHVAPPQEWLTDTSEIDTLSDKIRYGVEILRKLAGSYSYEIRILPTSANFHFIGGEDGKPFKTLFESHNHWSKLFRFMRAHSSYADLWLTRNLIGIDDQLRLESLPKPKRHGSAYAGRLWRPGDPNEFEIHHPRRRVRM